MEPEELGNRLRDLRELHGISQRQLGLKCGVSNAMISYIESGTTTPSISTLKRILDIFPITVADFFSLETRGTSQVFFEAEELLELGSGSVSILQVGHDLHGRQLQVFVERYPPGTDTGTSHLIHEGEEAGVIIEGYIEATVGSETKRLRKGDCFHFDSSIPHRFHNKGSVDCVLISARSPASF